MGGYLAVAVSDFIRGIVEFAGRDADGVPARAPARGGRLPRGGAAAARRPGGDGARARRGEARRAPATPLGLAVPGWLTLAALVLITSLGPWALPQMVQKFYSIRSRADVTRALVIAGVFALFMSFGAYFSGALTHLYYGAKLPAGARGPGGADLGQDHAALHHDVRAARGARPGDRAHGLLGVDVEPLVARARLRLRDRDRPARRARRTDGRGRPLRPRSSASSARSSSPSPSSSRSRSPRSS